MIDRDGTPRLAGLGNVYVLPNSTAWEMENRAGTSRIHSPEMTVPEVSPGGSDQATHPTKASGICAFGFMAFEVQIAMDDILSPHSLETGSHGTPSDPRHQKRWHPAYFAYFAYSCLFVTALCHLEPRICDTLLLVSYNDK